MEKNKKVFIFLIITGIVLIFYSGQLLASKTKLDQPMRSVLIKQENEYIVRFDLTNKDSKDRNYTLSVLVDGKNYNEMVLLRSGKIFTYKHHIYPPVKDNKVIVSIYQENEMIPISENIFALGVS